MKRIIVVSIFFVLSLLIIADFVFFEIEKSKFTGKYETYKFFNPNMIYHFVKEIPHSTAKTDRNRSFIKNSEKSILLLGCSYTFGSNLEPNQSFSYYLSNLTGRTVYNLGVEGGGIQHMLYLTEDKDFTHKYKDVDLIIYTFIFDHIKRNNRFFNSSVFSPVCNFRMVKQGDEYVKANEWYAFLSKIFLFRYFLDGIAAIKNLDNYYQENCDSFVDMLNHTKRNLKTMYPDAKFVFLFFQAEKTESLTKNLDKDIYIFSTKEFDKIDLNRPEYRHGEDWHPTEKVWQDFVPLFVEKLKVTNCL